MNTTAQLSRSSLDEFKAIYLEEFGMEISDDEAREIGSRLLRVFLALGEQGLGSPI